MLREYPLIAALAYREYCDPPGPLAEEIATLVRKPQRIPGQLHGTVESVHTGQLCNIHVSPKASIRWLADQAQKGLGVSEFADTGAYTPFRVRWVLVDSRAEEVWRALPRSEQQKLRSAVQTNRGPRFSSRELDRLEDIGIYDGIVFHMYAIEDIDYPPMPEWRKL